MTPKMKKFCLEYASNGNATQSAIKAGYAEKTAYSQGQRLLKKVEIRAYIEQRMAEKEKELIADQDEILKYLTAVLRGESESEEIVVESIGDYMTEARTMKKAPSEKDKLKAAELLGKRYNLFSDKMKVDVALPVIISGSDELED